MPQAHQRYQNTGSAANRQKKSPLKILESPYLCSKRTTGGFRDTVKTGCTPERWPAPAGQVQGAVCPWLRIEMQRHNSLDPLPDPSTVTRPILMTLLREAARVLGLRPGMLATLDALLSCLPPNRAHHMVFASNATLVQRLNCISDRTLRRHLAALVATGLVTRHNSPNRKRFVRRNATTGETMRFGLDLSPLFGRLAELAQTAAEARALRERVADLRLRIRVAAARRLETDPHDHEALCARRLLRRRLTLQQCENQLLRLRAETDDLSAEDGDSVRHQQTSRKESFETKAQADRQSVRLVTLKEACPDTLGFAVGPVDEWGDVVTHARMLAPMLGINARNLGQAEKILGAIGASMTVWAITQRHGQIRNAAAYFHALTMGRRSKGFDPAAMVERMANGPALRSGNASVCPERHA